MKVLEHLLGTGPLALVRETLRSKGDLAFLFAFMLYVSFNPENSPVERHL